MAAFLLKKAGVRAVIPKMILGSVLLCTSCCLAQVQAVGQGPVVASKSDAGVISATNTGSGVTKPIVLARTSAPSIETAEGEALLAARQPLLAQPPLVRPSTRVERTLPSAKQVHIWEGLILAEHSAAAFDAWSTRKSITSGNGYERDPLMKPFANSAAIYPMLQAVPLGMDFLSRRLMRSNNRLFRGVWWLPQSVSFGASIWCGSRNLHVANLKK